MIKYIAIVAGAIQSAALIIPWSIIPIFIYAIGSSIAYPSLTLLVMDLFPWRRGMATSLSAFVGGIINALVAGLLSPALSHSPLWLAVGMGAMMLSGLLCWMGYRRMVKSTR